MTPQEKAIELFDKFDSILFKEYNNLEAKKCALIAVNEICRAVEFLDDETEDFWLDVKIEIEKL